MQLPLFLVLVLGAVSSNVAGALGARQNPREARDRLESHDQCSVPQRDTCTFYRACLETRVPCGADGYALAYGDFYCNKFEPVLKDFSDEGRVWVSAARYCLQQRLVPYATGLKKTGCGEIKAFAFASHPPCYLENGLCSLPPSDWLVVLHTVGTKGLFGNVGSFVATLKAAAGCIDLYIWLIGSKIIGLEDDQDIGQESPW